METNEIRLNLECGSRPLINYINIDQNTLEEMRKRYPNQEFDNDLTIKQYDLFNLPFENHTV